MIDHRLFLAFVAAVVFLMLLPGPNVALIVANSVNYGTKFGLLTVAGADSAMVFQLGLTALGMTEVLGSLGVWFERLRWVGAIYLIYLGIVQWRAPAANPLEVKAAPKSPRAIYFKALFVSLTNPKTLLFYSAFFPQFVTVSRPVGPQVAILSLTFILVALAIDSSWALAASRARRVLASRVRLRNRISGSILIGAGAALALARKK